MIGLGRTWFGPCMFCKRPALRRSQPGRHAVQLCLPKNHADKGQAHPRHGVEDRRIAASRVPAKQAFGRQAQDFEMLRPGVDHDPIRRRLPNLAAAAGRQELVRVTKQARRGLTVLAVAGHTGARPAGGHRECHFDPAAAAGLFHRRGQMSAPRGPRRDSWSRPCRSIQGRPPSAGRSRPRGRATSRAWSGRPRASCRPGQTAPVQARLHRAGTSA